MHDKRNALIIIIIHLFLLISYICIQKIMYAFRSPFPFIYFMSHYHDKRIELKCVAALNEINRWLVLMGNIDVDAFVFITFVSQIKIRYILLYCNALIKIHLINFLYIYIQIISFRPSTHGCF